MLNGRACASPQEQLSLSLICCSLRAALTGTQDPVTSNVRGSSPQPLWVWCLKTTHFSSLSCSGASRKDPIQSYHRIMGQLRLQET